MAPSLVRPAARTLTMAALVLWPGVASAQGTSAEEGRADPAAVERSRKLFEEAVAHADKNQWANACPLFEAAHHANATGGTAIQLARCREMHGKPDEAIALYEWILARRASQPETRVALAETRLRILREQAEKLRAAAEAKAEPKPAPKPAPAPTPTPAPPEPAGPSRIPTVVALGIGGVGIVAGGVFGALALSKAADVEALCGGGACPDAPTLARAETLERDSDTFAWISNVGIGIGIVGVAVGVVLLATHNGSARSGALPRRPSALRLEPTATGLRARF